MKYEVLEGNCLDRLKDIESNSIHSVVTSPPYYALRDYGTGQWVGGDENCEHQGDNVLGNNRNGLSSGECSRQANNPALSSGQCVKCGATKEDEQIGLESTLQGYIDNMVKVFREVRRVLRDDGTVWLNIGDSYNGSGGAGGDYNEGGLREGQNKYGKKDDPRFKPKDLMLVPHRLAIALQEDGWWVRQDIVWAKNNPMPEPAKDRCVKAHEYIFLLTKSKDYYFDYQAIQEPVADASRKSYQRGSFSKGVNHDRNDNDMGERTKGVVFKSRNKRSVWQDTKYESIEEEATYRQGMHKQRGENIVYFRPNLPNQNDFVDFIRLNPKENLLNLGIKQSTIDHWYRYDQSGFSYPSIEDWEIVYPYLVNEDKEQMNSLMTKLDWKYDDVKFNDKRNKRSVWTVNTKAYKGAHFAVFPPDLVEPCILTTPKEVCFDCGSPYECDCETEERKPAVILDIFGGSGTTAGVALKNGRNAILIELNPEYIKLIDKRIESILNFKIKDETRNELF